MKTALWIIAACAMLNTFDVYRADGGWNVYAGAYGWHFAGE